MDKIEFTHTVKEESTIISATDHYSAQIGSYDVIFTFDEHSGADLSIYPADSRQFPKLGIIRCRPESVGAIEAFAEVVGDLLRSIATALRDAGKDDLRNNAAHLQDEMRRQTNEMLVEWKKPTNKNG